MTERRIDLVGEGSSIPIALQTLLRNLLPIIDPAPPVHESADRSVKIRAEGESLAGVVTRLIEQLCAIGADFNEHPVQVTIEGYREQAGEVRAWGVAGVAPSESNGSPAIEILGAPEIARDDQLWRIKIPVAVLEPEL